MDTVTGRPVSTSHVRFATQFAFIPGHSYKVE